VLADCFNGGVKSALVTCGLVLVHNAFIRHSVNDRYGLAVSILGTLLVAALDGRDNFLDVGAHHGRLARIVAASYFGLASALLCLG